MPLSYPRILPFTTPLDKRAACLIPETRTWLENVVSQTKISMPSENVLVVDYPENLVGRVKFVNIDDSILRIDFYKDKEDLLGYCFFPEIPWNRKNFFGNGRWNSGVITGKDGHKEFRCNPIS